MSKKKKHQHKVKALKSEKAPDAPKGCGICDGCVRAGQCAQFKADKTRVA